ncbi:rhodanese-like domain-containing protein [Halorussus amylolyticus]|uniref:rhodanese-like domain-containing protein n=1 Tax=Halorussus amylolyticus TaxID=1126242 RepID=UPI00192F27D4|nr:rhodanese-like domain-containing protein [Halorussus amylolyticus]
MTAGCLGGVGGGNGGSGDGDGSDLPTPSDENTDGYPPEFDDVPEERDIDTSSFGTSEHDGVDVPLAPVDVTHYWYKRGEARFADARGAKQYEESRVYGAVLSPSSGRDDDPVADWPKDERIVCYCGCPHHLSGIRAADLIQNGYEEVYVIDEGFWEWFDLGYPVRGSDTEDQPENWVIRGETEPAHATDDAWAFHDPTDQTEATRIGDDGSYELHLKFHDVGPDSTIQVETPAYTVEGKLSDLSVGTVQG